MYWFGTFAPERVLMDLGVIQIYWYSAIIVVAVLAALYVVRRRYLIDYDSDHELVDVIFYVVVCGLMSARLWHVFVFQWEYYARNLGDIFKIWEGGIAIQGALVGGLLCVYVYSKIRHVNPWKYLDCLALGVPLGQAIGRWGNFFNQELYGLPTDKPWGIFIEEASRVPGFEYFTHFHPAFFYESVLNVTFFVIVWYATKRKRPAGFATAMYFMGYGVIRFVVDFVRIDPMPAMGVLRFSQVISLFFIAFAASYLVYTKTTRRWRRRSPKV